MIHYHYSHTDSSKDTSSDSPHEDDPADLHTSSLKKEYRAFMVSVADDADVGVLQAELEALIQKEQLAAEVSTGPRVLQGLEAIAIHCSERVAKRLESCIGVTRVLDVTDFQLRLPRSLLPPDDSEDVS